MSPLASPEAPARLALPSHQSGAPREAAAEGRDQDQVPFLDAPGGQRLLQRHVHRRGARVAVAVHVDEDALHRQADRKSTRLNSSHVRISYAVFCLKKKKKCLDQALLVHAIHLTKYAQARLALVTSREY